MPAKSIVWIVSRLYSCRAFLGLLLFAGSLAYGEPCAVVYGKAALSDSDLTTLQGKGYAPKAVSELSDSLISLRRHVSAEAFAITPKGKSLTLHFELAAGADNFPLLAYTYENASKVPTCEETRRQIGYLTKLRGKIVSASLALETKGQLLDALLTVEEAFSLSKNRVYPSAEVRANIERLKKESRSIWSQSEGLPIWSRLNLVRRHLLSEGLRSYCRDFPRLADLTEKKCTNCVGQTQLILGILEDLKVEEQGVKLAFNIYQDHLQPVVQVGSEAVDGMTFKPLSAAEAHDPRELIGIALRRWRGLIFSWDKIDSRWVNPPKNLIDRMSSWTASPKSVMSDDEVFDWRALSMQAPFSQTPPPEFTVFDDLENPPQTQKPAQAARTRCGDREFGILKPVAEAMLDNVHPADKAELMARASDVKPACMDSHEFVRTQTAGGELQVLALQPLYLIKFDSDLNVEGLSIVPDWLMKDGYRIPVFKFRDPHEFEAAKRLRYSERTQMIAAKLSAQFTGIVAEDLAKLTSVFQANNVMKAFLNDEQGISLATLRLAYMLQGSVLNSGAYRFRDEAFPPSLIAKMIPLQESVERWAKRLADKPRQHLTVFNTYSNDELERFFGFLKTLPLRSVSRFILISTWMIEVQGAARIWPLEAFFTAVLRDSSIWKMEDGQSQLQAPAKLSPEPLFKNMPQVDLPKVNLAIDCGNDSLGRDMGGLFVACPLKPPAPEPVVMMRDLKPALLVGLMLNNPQMFFHPGHLLMLSSLWSAEVAELLREMAFTYDRQFFDGHNLPATVDMVNAAISSRKSIISTPYVYDLRKVTSMDCHPYDSFPVTTCNINEELHQLSRESTGNPAWLNEHPMYPVLYRNLRSVRSTCNPQSSVLDAFPRGLTFWGMSQLQILSKARVGRAFRSTVQIGSWLVDYRLYPDAEGCYQTVEPINGLADFSLLAVPSLAEKSVKRADPSININSFDRAEFLKRTEAISKSKN